MTFREVLHAEWTKIRTTPGTGWLLVAVVAVTIGIGAVATSAVRCTALSCDQDPAKIGLAGVGFGQALVAVLAVLVVSGEYGSGMIRVTFTAMPHRTAVLAAKTTVLSGLVMTAGVVAVSVSIVVGHLVLPSRGFPADVLSFTDGPVLRAGVGSVLYLILVGLLGLGIAAAVRDAAFAMGCTLALLYLFPILAVFGDDLWRRHVQQFGPMTAGLAIQSTADIATLPVAPWIGLGVLAAWSAAALVGGWLLVRFRDV